MIFQSTFLYWEGEIHTLILKLHNFTRIRTIELLLTIQLQYTHQVLESIVPSSWSKQLNDDKAPFVHEYSTYIANR